MDEFELLIKESMDRQRTRISNHRGYLAIVNGENWAVGIAQIRESREGNAISYVSWDTKLSQRLHPDADYIRTLGAPA